MDTARKIRGKSVLVCNCFHQHRLEFSPIQSILHFTIKSRTLGDWVLGRGSVNHSFLAWKLTLPLPVLYPPNILHPKWLIRLLY